MERKLAVFSVSEQWHKSHFLPDYVLYGIKEFVYNLLVFLFSYVLGYVTFIKDAFFQIKKCLLF